MSLLLSEGHSDAAMYPVAVTWSEARLVRERQSSVVRGDAIVMQTVIASVLTKEGNKAFQKLLKRMEDVG